MLICPVCKVNKGSYYKATSEALGDLVDLMPSLSDGVEHWLYLDGTPEGFADKDRAFEVVVQNKDRMLVLICQDCAVEARDLLKLSQEDFEQLQGFPCPCCGYYTLGDLGCFEICSVCFWEDDGDWDLNVISGPNHITLRAGRRNFQEMGACDEHSRRFVRPPKPEEHPRYYL